VLQQWVNGCIETNQPLLYPPLPPPTFHPMLTPPPLNRTSTTASLTPSARTLGSGRVCPSPGVTSCKCSSTTCALQRLGQQQQLQQQMLLMLVATLTTAVAGRMEGTQQQHSRQRSSMATGSHPRVVVVAGQGLLQHRLQLHLRGAARGAALAAPSHGANPSLCSSSSRVLQCLGNRQQVQLLPPQHQQQQVQQQMGKGPRCALAAAPQSSGWWTLQRARCRGR
jgi:hypothetical protein